MCPKQKELRFDHVYHCPKCDPDKHFCPACVEGDRDVDGCAQKGEDEDKED